MKDLKFDYNLGDVVRLDDGRTAIIIQHGIYDNQYWCEVCYPDGLHLGAADYYSSDPTSYGIKIVGLAEDKRESVISAAILTMRKYQEKWHDSDFSDRLNHLLSFIVQEKSA